MRRLVVLPALAAFLISAVPAPAQDAYPTSQDRYQGPAPAHVAVVDGRVTLERDGQADAAPLNAPLLSGDRLRTADGRVEVLFGDGSTLLLDAGSTVDVQADDLVRLIDGRLRVNLLGTQPRFRIDSPAGSVRIDRAGEYRIALLRDGNEVQLELAVLRGSAQIFTAEGATDVRAGERAYASEGLAPSYAYAYNSASWDDFDRWSEQRRAERMGQSAQYLPSDMRMYSSVMDEYGDWRYAQPYGYVWYPRVAADWRPYYYGRWAAYPRYGWTWIGVEHFAWPTHHYGRWGFNAGAWFWIPGSAWAPAYVSWGFAPGYVSWCPLGYNNYAVFSLNVGFGRYSPWYGWTAVSRGHFGHGYVHERATHWDRSGRGGYPAFQPTARPPVGTDIAVTRRAAVQPIVGPSPRAGVSTPRYVNNGDRIIPSQSARPRAPVTSGAAGGSAQPSRDGYAPQRRGNVGAASPPAAATVVPRGSPGAQGGASAGTWPSRTDRVEAGRTVPVRPGIPADRAMERGVAPTYGAPTVPRMNTRPYDPQSRVDGRGYYGAPGSRAPGPSPNRSEGAAPSYERPAYGARPMPSGPRSDPSSARPAPSSGGERAAPRGGADSPARSGGSAAPAGRPAPSGGVAAPRGGRGGR